MAGNPLRAGVQRRQPRRDEGLLTTGYRAKRRPSGHEISKNFARDNGAAIPPNLIALPNTESNIWYLRYCNENDIKPHPARFPAALPEYFVRMLTDPGDRVLDPFAGSCVTGEVAERLERRWICVEREEEYLRGAKGRFVPQPRMQNKSATRRQEDGYYRIPNPGLLWTERDEEPLPSDGGQRRPQATSPNPRHASPKPGKRSQQLELKARNASDRQPQAVAD